MSKTQKITIAVMALVGLLLAALMLMPRRGAVSAQAQAESGERAGRHEAEPEKIALDDAQATAAGIELAVAAPARIVAAVTLPGEIRFNEDRTAHVVP